MGRPACYSTFPGGRLPVQRPKEEMWGWRLLLLLYLWLLLLRWRRRVA
jgi:hypothetical protein